MACSGHFNFKLSILTKCFSAVAIFVRVKKYSVMPEPHTQTSCKSDSLRLQHNAARAALFTVGIGFAAWTALIPFVKIRTGLDDGALGFLLISVGIGAMCSMPVTGVVVGRLGCRVVIRVGTGLMCLLLPLLGYLENVLLLRIGLICYGAAFASVEVAANMQAVEVQRLAGRSIMSNLHAFYSIGSIAGAGCMTLLFSLGFKPLSATLLCALIIAALTIYYDRGALTRTSSGNEPQKMQLALPRGIVLLLGFMLLIAYMSEGSVANWGALLLHGFKGFAPEHGALGFAVFSITLTGGRLVGDRLITKVGSDARMIVFSCLSGAACYLLTIYVLPGAFALVGFAAMGLCISTLAPTIFSLTGKQKVMPVELAIAAISILGYGSALVSSPSIGLVARATSLPTSLGLLSLLLGATAFSAFLFRKPKAEK